MNSNSGRLSVCEIFWSSQGEGDRYGFPSVFIRLSGCSLHCSYCDTSNSWQGGDSLELENILSRVQCLMESYPHSQIVLTGGEPLEQDLTVLVQELKKKNITWLLKQTVCISRNLR